MTTSKKPSLAVAMKQATSKVANLSTEEATPTPATNTEAPASRQGKKIISGHFDPAVSRQLKQIALDKGTTVQNLLRESLNDLFEKHGQKPIA